MDTSAFPNSPTNLNARSYPRPPCDRYPLAKPDTYSNQDSLATTTYEYFPD